MIGYWVMKGYCIFSQIHKIHEVKSVTLMHRIRSLRKLCRIIFLSLILPQAITSGIAEEISFNRDVRPILSANCFSCHGPDKKARKATLRLDTREGALFDLGGYRAIEPGKPDDSELILRIESDDPEDIMPPPNSGHELTQEDRKTLRQWISVGGEYQTHWSFERPVKAPLPKTEQKGWTLRPLDHFILKRLEANGLSPSKDADRHHWIRRVSLDLTGLPPTPEEADAFAADKSENAHKKVVDRLLGSEAYGEHWARMCSIWRALPTPRDMKKTAIATYGDTGIG